MYTYNLHEGKLKSQLIVNISSNIGIRINIYHIIKIVERVNNFYYFASGFDIADRHVIFGNVLQRDSLKDAGYSSMTSKDVQSMIFTFVNILQTIVMGFGILALVVSVFGIINTAEPDRKSVV